MSTNLISVNRKFNCFYRLPLIEINFYQLLIKACVKFRAWFVKFAYSIRTVTIKLIPKILPLGRYKLALIDNYPTCAFMLSKIANELTAKK